jgi:hypothetical protein
MANKRFIHDPDCTITRDIAQTADWDDPKYRPPKCSCLERQKARRRITSHTGGSSQRGVMEGASIGEGCFIKLPAEGYT